MPNRVIKESIKRSPQIDALTWFEEVVYYRLMVTADDYGCMDGRTVLLKSELFPLKESVTKKAVEDAISKLVSVGLLCRYTANGMPYLCFPTWTKHQRLRNKHRKYPNPEEYGLTVTCQANDSQESDIGRSEIESESEIEKEIQKKGTEPQAPSVLTLLLNDGSEYGVTQKDIDEWQDTFPNVDVLQQLKAMKLWLKDSPKKRKTRNGIRRFVTNWLDREQNRGGTRQTVAQQPTRVATRPPDASLREKAPDFFPDWAEGGYD